MPQVRFRDAGNTLRTCARIRMRDAGNTLRQIQRIRMRDAGNVLRTVWQFFSVALSASIVTGSNSGAASSGTVTSSSVTGTPTGGTAPYTYAWQYVSGDATVTPTSPTAATTTFSSTTVTELGKIAFFQLQVTDNVGNVVTSSVLEVQLYWSDTR
jgi:hypothetical protein